MEDILQKLENLNNFLTNIQGIDNHPYSTGVNVTKLLEDLKSYIQEIIDGINAKDENIEQ